MEHARRCFIGIMPDGQITHSLRRTIRMLPDAPVIYGDPSHARMTIAFVGHVTDQTLPQLIADYAAVFASCRPFSVHFDHIGVTPVEGVPKMVVATAAAASDELADLTTCAMRVLAPMHPPVAPVVPKIALGRVIATRWRACEPKPQISRTIGIDLFIDHVTLFESARVQGVATAIPLATWTLGEDSLIAAHSDL